MFILCRKIKKECIKSNFLKKKKIIVKRANNYYVPCDPASLICLEIRGEASYYYHK